MTVSRRVTRRRLLGWFATAGVASLLAGCAAKTVEKVVKETEIVEKVVKETVAVNKEKAQIIFVERAGKEGALFSQVVEAFNRVSDSTYVTFQPVATGVWEKIQTLYASGTPPDVHYALDAAQDLAAGGMLLSLSPLIEKDPSFDLSDYYEEHLENAYYNNELYALNWTIAPVVLYCNLTLYREAGIEPLGPNLTWDSARELAERLTRKDETWGWGPQDTVEFIQHIWQAGWEMWTEDYSRSTLDEPEVIEAVDFWANLVRSGYSPSPEQQAGRGGLELFQTGKIANMVDGVWQMVAAKDWDFEWQIYYHPKKVVSTGINWCSFDGISAKTKHPDECWEFLKYWSSPEAQYKYNKELMYIPPRKSVNSMKPYVNPDLPHVNWDLYLTAAEQGHRPPACPRSSEVVWSVTGKAFEEILAGKKTTKEALTEAAPKATELLRAGFGLEETH